MTGKSNNLCISKNKTHSTLSKSIEGKKYFVIISTGFTVELRGWAKLPVFRHFISGVSAPNWADK